MNNLNDFTALILPGRGGSGPDHWQTAWQIALPTLQRVKQSDWDRPVYENWAANLSAAVAQSDKPVLLIAHSLGTSLTMRWAHDQAALAKRIAGAFLVAPTDRDLLEGNPEVPVEGFGKMILTTLPFPSMVVASRNDELVTFTRAEVFAAAWGSTLVDAGSNGHLGSAAKLGVWPFGLIALGQFLATLPTT